MSKKTSAVESNCKTFGKHIKSNPKCKKCTDGKEQCIKMAEAENKAAQDAKKKPTLARTEAGFVVGGKRDKIYNMLCKKPYKMGELKKQFGDTYYNLFKKKPEIFQNRNGYWFVTGKVLIKNHKELKLVKKTEKKESK